MNFKMIVTAGNHSALVKKVLLARGNWQCIEIQENLESQILKANFIWSPNSLTLRYYSIVDEYVRENPQKMILLNHFQNHRIITTKVNLIRTLRNYYSKQQNIFKANYGVFVTTPTTFIITVGTEDKEYFDFCQRFYQLEKQNYYKQKIPAKHCKENLWLVKPANLNQGRGIEIFKNLKQISNFLTSKPLNTVWVIQKYIERPLLYHNRKFDIRVWVIVTNKCEIYFYKKGYIRTSSDTYSMDNFNNYVHLTNNCLQKFGSGYSKFQEGNTLPIEILEQYIKSLDRYKEYDFNLERDIISRVKDLIIDTVVAGKRTFNSRRKQFELFGYDFLVDQDLRTWLIQVNTNPYLGVPNDYIKDLLNLMIDDMLKLVVDPLFLPKNKNIYSDKNGFQLLYSEELQKNLRSPFTKPVYPIEQLAPPSNKQKKIEQVLYDEKKSFKEYNIEQNIKNLLESYAFNDFEPFHKPVSYILSNLINWELHTEQYRTLNCRLLKSVFQSKYNNIFAEESYLQSIVKIIDSQTYPTEIQSTVIEGIICLCKSMAIKKKVISPILITSLVKIALSLFNAKQYKEIDKKLISISIKCLIASAGVYQFKYFIPGQTRQNEAIRQLFIKCNGLCVLLLALKDEDLKNQIQQFLDKLDVNDWEFQLNLLKQEDIQINLIKTKLLQRANTGEDTILDTSPTIKIYQSQLIEIVQKKLTEINQRNQAREKQLREKRQKLELFQKKIKEEKLKLMQQRRIRAEEYLKKKLLQRTRVKLQEERKQAELKLQQEQKKKKQLEESLKRRSELKLIRNDSKQKLERQEKQQINKDKQSKKKYTNQEKTRILTEWLQNKKEEQRKKKEQQKQEQLKKNKIQEEKKLQIQKRIIQIKERNKKRVSSQDRQDKSEEKNLPVSLLEKKSRFPLVPKSDKRVALMPLYTLKDSDEQQQSIRQLKNNINESASKVPNPKYQSDEKKVFKHFFNTIKRVNKKNKVVKVNSNELDTIDKKQQYRKDKQIYSVHQMSQQVSKKYLRKAHTNNTEDTKMVINQKLDKKQEEQEEQQSKDKAKVILDFLMSSPYSSFVRKHYKVKQLLQEIQKQGS